MARKQFDHNHRYEKVSDLLYKCVVPECPHIISSKILVGRRAECPTCKDTFLVNKEHLRRKKMHCLKCSKNGKPAQEVPMKDNSPFSTLLQTKGIK